MVLFLKWVKNYYPQVFLEKPKYIIKEKKITKYINDNLEFSSDDSDEEAADELEEFDNCDDKASDKE